MKHTAKTFVILAATLVPAAAFAGAYGSSAVRDANVTNSGASGQTVWCDRIEADIPNRLAAQMDCGGSAVAARRTAPRRVAVDDGNDNDDSRNRPLPTPTLTSNSPDPTGDPDDTPTASREPVAKWDRLGELGVTRETFSEQSDAFREEFHEYREEHGGDGDWAGFKAD